MTAESPEGFPELLAEAVRLYEDDDFAGAVRAFRAAALLAPLPGWAWDNLAFAEGEELVDFRRRGACAFSDSFDAALAEIDALALAGHRRQAIVRCTEWLGRPGLTKQEIRRLRATRLRAAERGGDPATYAADFAHLWNLESPNQERVRLNLLRTLITLDWSPMVDALTTLRDRLGGDADLDRIIATKVEQLATVARIKANLPPIRRRPGPDATPA